MDDDDSPIILSVSHENDADAALTFRHDEPMEVRKNELAPRAGLHRVLSEG